MLVTVERRKIRDIIASQLKAYISSRNLQPGDRLPTETQLAAQFGVSRLSLREATKSLEFLGIVESRQRRGLTVGQINMERMTEYLEFHPALQKADPEQMIQTRIVIETGVLPYVVERIQGDSTIVETLQGINDKLRKTSQLSKFIELDLAFHRCLVESSGLTPLLPFNDLLAVFFQRFRESVKKAEWGTGIDNHEDLITLLRDGKQTQASRLLRGHIESHRTRI